MTRKQARDIAKSWSSALIWAAGRNSFDSGLSAADEKMIIEEMNRLSIQLGRYFPIRNTLPDIIKSILDNEKN